MHKFNLELCQTLLKQTNSIDETARLMAVDDDNKYRGFAYRKKQILAAINKKELKI